MPGACVFKRYVSEYRAAASTRSKTNPHIAVRVTRIHELDEGISCESPYG